MGVHPTRGVPLPGDSPAGGLTPGWGLPLLPQGTPIQIWGAGTPSTGWGTPCQRVPQPGVTPAGGVPLPRPRKGYLPSAGWGTPCQRVPPARGYPCWWGTPAQTWEGVPPISWIGYPLPKGTPKPGGTPCWWGTPAQTWKGVPPSAGLGTPYQRVPPARGYPLLVGYPCPDLGRGTPISWMGYPLPKGTPS